MLQPIYKYRRNELSERPRLSYAKSFGVKRWGIMGIMFLGKGRRMRILERTGYFFRVPVRLTVKLLVGEVSENSMLLVDVPGNITEASWMDPWRRGVMIAPVPCQMQIGFQEPGGKKDEDGGP